MTLPHRTNFSMGRFPENLFHKWLYSLFFAVHTHKKEPAGPDRSVARGVFNFYLFAAETGRPLLEERIHSLDAVFGVEGEPKESGFQAQTALKIRFRPLVDRFFDVFHGNRGLLGQTFRQFAGLFQQLVVGNHLLHQSQPERLFGGDHLPRQAQVFGGCLPHQPREALRAPVAGDHSQIHFRLTEAGADQ